MKKKFTLLIITLFAFIGFADSAFATTTDNGTQEAAVLKAGPPECSAAETIIVKYGLQFETAMAPKRETATFSPGTFWTTARGVQTDRSGPATYATIIFEMTIAAKFAPDIFAEHVPATSLGRTTGSGSILCGA